jgi:hypothetical protein
VSVFCAQGTITVTLSDALDSATFTTNFAVGDLPTLLGAQTAFVGFSRADGGIASNQQASNFVFLSYPVLQVQVSGANATTPSWPASIGGYGFQQSAAVPRRSA